MSRDVTLDATLARARDRLARVSPNDLESAVRRGAILVDVRDTAQRHEQGSLPGAHVIDLTILEWRLAPSSDSRPIDVFAEPTGDPRGQRGLQVFPGGNAPAGPWHFRGDRP